MCGRVRAVLHADGERGGGAYLGLRDRTAPSLAPFSSVRLRTPRLVGVPPVLLLPKTWSKRRSTS